MATEFSQTVRATGSVQLVALGGELDLASIDALAGTLEDLAGAEVVIDLADLTFMDSSGIGAIARAHQELSQSGGSLVVVRPQPQVRRLLELTGLAAWIDEWDPSWSG